MHSRRRSSNAAGYSLTELLVSMGVLTLVMGATMAGVTQATRANEAVVMMTGMNASLRASMDLMIRDLLQTGSGLGTGHTIEIPSGAGAAVIRLPGPPGSAYTSVANTDEIAAVIPGLARGPVINGVATDMLTVLMADNTFTDVPLTAATNSTVDLNANDFRGAPVTFADVVPGQLIMLKKGALSALVQITQVTAASRRLTFGAGDSLNLNQPAAAAATLPALNAAAPANTPAQIRASRVWMISYYIDSTTVPQHPRLVRRVNNGHATNFDNTLGTAVAMDIENMQISYDLADGNTNPSNVRFTANDLNGGGACAPDPCSGVQVRKVNITLTGRSENARNRSVQTYRNTLTSQVSLRSMAFVNQYKANP